MQISDFSSLVHSLATRQSGPSPAPCKLVVYLLCPLLAFKLVNYTLHYGKFEHRSNSIIHVLARYGLTERIGGTTCTSEATE